MIKQSAGGMPSPLTRTSSCNVVALLTTFLLTLTLFGVVALRSHGFDDEMGNIELIERLGTWQTVLLMQTEDVHPPGGYLLNGLLFDALGSWSAVRLVSALLYSLSLTSLLAFVQREHGGRAAVLAWLVAGLAPGALMWCTSLRWYAYFTPLLIWALVSPRDTSQRWYYIKPALLWLLMAYVNYAALIIAPSLLIWNWMQSGLKFPIFLRKAFLPWFISAMAFAPQFYVFLTVHSKGSASQTGGVVKSLLGSVISLMSNQGIFPISIFGIGSILAWLCLAALIFKHVRTDPPLRGAIGAFGAGVGAFIATGLAGKFRNLVLLTPIQALIVARSEPLISRSRLAQGCLSIIVMANLLGCFNVVTHQGTTKNSWNLPVNAVLASIKNLPKLCAGKTEIYTFDVVLARNLRQSRSDLTVHNYYDRFDKPRAENSECVIVIHTYKGALTNDAYNSLLAAESVIGGKLIATERIQLDPDAALKRRIDPDFPEFMVEINLIKAPTDLHALNEWVKSRN